MSCGKEEQNANYTNRDGNYKRMRQLVLSFQVKTFKKRLEWMSRSDQPRLISKPIQLCIMRTHRYNMHLCLFNHRDCFQNIRYKILLTYSIVVLCGAPYLSIMPLSIIVWCHFNQSFIRSFFHCQNKNI